ncbi:MAG: NAD(P)H-binding protein [Bacillota bacterium]
MEPRELDVVTGAFGYTGKYITRRLLTRGRRVRTLTGHPDRPNPFGERVEVRPFRFDNPAALVESLTGAATLYNTYWVRFPYGPVTYEKAVENTLTLIRAAEEAGVRRIVHISITNASEDSSLPYFRGKGILEKAIVSSRLSYAIVRPTVIFGAEDILINNIAWILRRFPFFAVPGRGDYRLQPVYVEDVAEIAVRAGQEDTDTVMDAVGPEIFTFEEMVRLIAARIGRQARIIHVPPGMALFLARMVGYAVGDVVLTRDEVRGLMANLLVSGGPPTAPTRFSDWLAANAGRVGTAYASELARHYRRK